MTGPDDRRAVQTCKVTIGLRGDISTTHSSQSDESAYVWQSDGEPISAERSCGDADLVNESLGTIGVNVRFTACKFVAVEVLPA